MSGSDNDLRQKPVIFLAFANDRIEGMAYLRNLPGELRGIREVLDKARKSGLCELVERANAAVTDILDVFQDETYKNRIAIFHYGGHANCYQLLLEAFTGEHAAAHKEGLVSFLGRQEGLKLIFLNGCSSQQHALELINSGIPAVVGTSQSIDDEIAANLSIRFYNGIANGFSIERAWQDAVDEIKISKGISDFRALYWQGKKDKEDRFPWDIFYKRGGEKVKGWNLPEAANDPLFGLPQIPASYRLPESPFLFLRRYEKKHAKIFFGRSYYIRNLYNRIVDAKSPGIILLYGQSGVGKSSLLDAGLIPRLEGSHSVIYARRVREKGLLGTFQEALENHPLIKGERQAAENLTIPGKWQLIESRTGNPLVVILDQAEEMYTRPNKELPGEFVDFLALLKKIFGNPYFSFKGKLILTYRKEYHPEIDKKFASYELPRSWLFLEPLSREDILEVVTGLTKTSELRQRYFNIEVEENLPIIIADDLLEDKSSPIAPVLQILLTKMWENARAEESSNARFTVQKYRQLRKEGIAMDDFFKQQMAKLRAWDPDVVDSGLALDLLKFHTTQLSTSCSRNSEDIRQTYLESQDTVDDLLQKLKDLYLITDTQHTKDETSLTHDTLAPLVIKECSDSQKPGQRAARILAAKIEDFKRNESKVWLDEADLAIVELGKNGMRALDEDEEKLLKISRERKAQRERVKRRIIKAAVLLISLIIISTVFAFYQWKTASEEKEIAEQNYKSSEANRLTLLAQEIETEDPTLALDVAGRAYQLYKNQIVTEAVYKIYRENIFYKILAKQEEAIAAAVFSPDGKSILIGSGFNASLLDFLGNKLLDFKGHRGVVTSVAFSPDGNYVVTTSFDGTARLWNLQGKEILVFGGDKYRVKSAAFSPDGKFVLTGLADKTAILWDLQGNKLQDFKGHNKGIYSVAFSPGDSKKILTASGDGIVCLWHLEGTQLKAFKAHEDSIFSAAFSPDGKYILTGSRDKTARLWDLQGNELQTFRGHLESVTSAVFSPDGRNILTGSVDKTARLWDFRGKELYVLKGHRHDISSISFLPDGKFILTGSRDKTARLWDLQGIRYRDFIGHKSRVFSTAISPDGNYILTGSVDKTARLWDRQGNELQVLKGHKEIVTSVVFSPDSKYILTRSWDRTARLWDLHGKELRVFGGDEHHVTTAVFSSDGQYIYTGFDDKTARLWDLRGKELQTFGGDKYHVTSAVFSPDGKYILTWSRSSKDGTLHLWNLQGKHLQAFKGHKKNIYTAAFSPNGKYIFTSSADLTARLWDLQGKVLQIFSGGNTIQTIAFPPDGKHILTWSGDGIARLWDLQGKLLSTFTGEMYGVTSAAFSPDGKYIVTTLRDGNALLWTEPGVSFQVLKGCEGFVTSESFSPDSKYIMTGSSDNVAHLWEIKMPLEEFLGKGDFEKLTQEQESRVGIKD